ncbi:MULTISPECIES: excalibur calcium-binding domain-containing protein [unclassified Acinetobacter]|uniref:excalibur calcium-binding domain-containing protein n=1 Tax=unclassified Acinetobacter TaxID=196816 RepID=UPI002934105F|nr:MULTISPECIES: excalibur calcium-binding domain-containing protein [unclassified Acinetobacter]WOE30521.1 excalibur calcium-binding domain-containing protein [Acinetobacter sp. SAAs470]WOE38712.1 excalibur calcium-binding domain-containing protein [Acinetobacter sp. SAAs474]
MNNWLYLTLFSALLCINSMTFAQRVSCKNFKTQQQAQAYFIQHKARQLDRDRDGQACDCLPGGNGQKCPRKK